MHRHSHAVSFGLYNVFSTTALTSTGTVTYSCTNQTYGADNHHNLDEQRPRNDQQSTANVGWNPFANYYLCQDVACSKLWGDMGFPYDSGPITIPARTNLAASLPIYGKIPAARTSDRQLYGHHSGRDRLLTRRPFGLGQWQDTSLHRATAVGWVTARRRLPRRSSDYARACEMKTTNNSQVDHHAPTARNLLLLWA